MSHMPPDAVFVEAVSGKFGSVYASNAADYTGVSANEEVWVVRFNRSVTICPPNGGPCDAPRSGVSVVVLDYATGAFLFSTTDAPGP
jgi:hypothetical protein